MMSMPDHQGTVLNRQFPRFLAAGGLAALANFSSRFLFSLFMPFEGAVVMAFLVGLASGFILSRHYVFANSGNALHVQIGYYLLVNLLALVQTWLLSVYGARWLTPQLGLELAQALAHLAGIMLPVFSSYFGHRYFTFKEHSPNGKH
jgi:putative flippase GtrA